MPPTLSSLPAHVPLFPLEGVLLLPRGHLPLTIFEPRYLKLVENVLGQGRFLGIIQPLSAPDENNKVKLQKTGCLGRISSFNEMEENRFFITLTGVARFQVAQTLDVATPYPQVLADYEPYHEDLVANVGALDVNRQGVLDVLRRYLEATNMSIDWQAIESADNESLINSLCIISPYGVQEKQALLEANTLAERAEILIALTEMVLAQMSSDNATPDNLMQ